jgi:hypothetical protein
MARDYFAELYVAGILGDRGWTVYFPKRDVGFDFVITKEIAGAVVIRPVQVKGKYPISERLERMRYGYIGSLSQVHPEMLLAIPFFSVDRLGAAPVCTAYCPRWRVRPQAGRGYACQPARWADGVPQPRREYTRFFDNAGLSAMEKSDWSTPPAQFSSSDI